MPYDERLADRVRELLAPRDALTERRMFGGIAWMLEGNMACGVLGEDLVVRLGREDAERALAEDGARRFDVTGRPMRGFVMVGAEALRDAAQLARWVDAGADHAASLPPK